MTHNLLIRSALAILLSLVGLGVAQVDERARALLDGLASGAEVTDIRTLDMSMTMTLHDVGEEVVTSTRTVIDYENERAAIVTATMGMNATMIYRDGSMSMNVGGMSLPVPAQMGEAFEGIFDSPATAGLLSDADATATFDGDMSYGGVLTGQQVTYTGNFGNPGMPSGDAQSMRFIFDGAGNLVGQVMETGGSVMVTVYTGEPLVDGALFFSTAEMYELDGDTAKHFATLTYDDLAINEPVDESVFR